MSDNINKGSFEKVSLKQTLSYGVGQFSDTIALQMFVFFIFTFYYAVVGINVNLITLGYIIWSIWNAINDSLLGALSDRTHTKWGRRTPFIMISVIPLCLITVFLWTPPLGPEIISFAYFIVAVILFDFIYTTYDLNYASLFPEMFQDLETRAKANTIKQIFTIIGLIVTFLLPTFIIPKLDDKKYYINWMYAGIIMSVLIAVGAIILLKFGIKERKEFSQDYKSAPSLLASLKFSIKSKSFRYFIVSDLMNWYVIGMLSTIVPLYAIFVLGLESESFLIGILLGIAFLSAGGFVNLWRVIANKFGVKTGMMLTQISYIIVLIPFMFISNFSTAIIAFVLSGIGIAGGLFFADIVLAAVIDEDELKTKINRSGGFYGINALITKLSTILVILSINVVFNSVGWTYFDPRGTTDATILGLRLLMSVFPIIALTIGLISMSKFPINKERYEQIKTELEKLRLSKMDNKT